MRPLCNRLGDGAYRKGKGDAAMAKRRISKLCRVENDHTITAETDRDFLYNLQLGLLLALKEQGQLNGFQFEIAAERLAAGFRKRYEP